MVFERKNGPRLAVNRSGLSIGWSHRYRLHGIVVWFRPLGLQLLLRR